MSAVLQPENQPILLRHDQTGVATLTLNRPSQFNSLSEELLAEFQAALDAIGGDPAVRVVVVDLQLVLVGLVVVQKTH